MNLTSTAGRAGTAPRAVSDDAAADDQLAVDARGNPESFGPLYTRHVEAVYLYLRARGGSDDEATELVDDQHGGRRRFTALSATVEKDARLGRAHHLRRRRGYADASLPPLPQRYSCDK